MLSLAVAPKSQTLTSSSMLCGVFQGFVQIALFNLTLHDTGRHSHFLVTQTIVASVSKLQESIGLLSFQYSD